MTMAGLTGMMITGTVGQREVFLDQIATCRSSRICTSPVARRVQALRPDTKSTREPTP